MTVSATRKARRRHLFCLLSIAALALAGCGGAGGTSSQGASSKFKLVNTAGTPTGPINTLNWALPHGEPASIDPSQGVDYSSLLVIHNLCDSFMLLRPDSSYAPNVAAVEEKTPTTIVVKLKPGIHFWDGKEATGEDVLFDLKWEARPASGLTFYFENVAAMSQTGHDEVTIHMKQPDVLLTKALDELVLFEKAYTEKAGSSFGTAKGGVMCSGPFKFVAWHSGSDIELEKNANYWNPAAAAHAQKVTLRFLSDTTALASGLASGEVDGAYQLPPAIIPRLKSATNGKLYYGPSRDYDGLYLTRPGGPAKSPKLRQAIMGVIDRKGIAEKVYFGAAEPNYGLVSTNAFEPGTEQIWDKTYVPTTQKENTLSPEAAKQLVKESGYKDEPLVMTIEGGNETQSQIAQLVQQEAREIGVDITIQPLQPTQFSEAGYTASQRTHMDLMLSLGFNGLADPTEIVGFELLNGSPYDWTDEHDPEVEAEYRRARQTPNDQQRAEMLAKLTLKGEAPHASTTLVVPDVVTFQNNRIAGAVTSLAWMFSPSLATIGAS